MIRIHASCVAIGAAGVLIRGPSGSGKSDLALRLIDEGAHLVADDQVLLAPGADGLIASCSPAIAGRIEVRGLGIVPLPHIPEAVVRLVLDLVERGSIERLPRPRRCALAGVALPLLPLLPFEVSATAKVRLAARMPAADIIGAR